jgi:hypothetical protein
MLSGIESEELGKAELDVELLVAEPDKRYRPLNTFKLPKHHENSFRAATATFTFAATLTLVDPPRK